MLNHGLKTYRLLHINTLSQLRHLRKIQSTDKTCLCGQLYIKNQRQSSFFKLLRVHSTQSDHRQKVVIETSNPIIDNIKVLPIDKNNDAIDKKTWRDKINPYVQLARWDKPIGIYLLYWPCAWSISLGTITSGVPPSAGLYIGSLFLGGAALMRGAGCTINDMWDKDIDKQVERTKSRPLASGAITQSKATVFLAAQLSAALAVLLQLNCVSIALGASSLLLVITYPLAKRFTNYPQVFLGATFNWGALLGYTAVQGTLDPYVCVPLYLGSLAWTVVYDTIYAHQDKEDDGRIGIKSTALTFAGRSKPVLYAALSFSSCCLAQAGFAADLSAIYYASVVGYAAHIGRQIYTLDLDNPTDCANKFKSNSLVGLILLLGILGGGYQTYNKNRQNNLFKGDEHKSCLFS